MAGSNGSIFRRIAQASVAAAMLFSALPAEAAHPSQGATVSRTMNGVEVRGRFLEVWGRSGSEQTNLYLNGLPITPVRPEISLEDGKSYETQWFERARYELHPDNPQPHDVLLGRLGAWDVEGIVDLPFKGVDKPSDADGVQKAWFGETRHTLSGKLLAYWTQYGGLQQFGYPLSEPFEETSRVDGKPYLGQYFERARMELHPEKPAPYDVELGLLGVEQHGLRAVPGDELPVAPQKDTTSSLDTIRIATNQYPQNLTFADDSAATRRIRSLIHDELVGQDDGGNLFPLNAWYVPTLENGGARFVGEGADRHLQVKYKLRRGIRWSDGVELTSNDAMFAYTLMLHPQAPVPGFIRTEHQRLQSADNPDKYTMIYKYRSLKEATDFYRKMLDQENYAYIKVFLDSKKPVISRSYSEIGRTLPQHILGSIPPDQIADSPYGRAPAGTGPWKVEQWTTGQQTVLVPNEQYSLTAKPPISRIAIRYGGDGATLIESQYKTGNIDLLTSESLGIPPGDVADITGAGGRIMTRPGPIWEHVDFFFDYSPFRERAVREGIITAINRQRLVDVAYRGSGAVMHSVAPSNLYYSLEHPDFAKNYPDLAAKYKLPIYPYDPDKAARLLDAAGWKCPAGNTARDCGGGVREKKGEKLSFEYGTTINAIRQQIQGLVQADLKAVGVDARVKSYPTDKFYDWHGPWRSGETKFAQFAWLGSKESDFSQWRCPDVFGQRTGSVQRYCNREVDEAQEVFNLSLSREAVAAAAEAQMLIMQDIAVVPLVQRPNIEVVNVELQNYKLTNGSNSSFWNARQWYFR